MNFFRLLFISLMMPLLTYCSKENANMDLPFEAKVLKLNSDCGIYEIKITRNLDNVKSIVGSSIEDSIYLAKNLPNELMVSNNAIKFSLRKPHDSEVGSCTTLGPSYTWIYIIKAVKK